MEMIVPFFSKLIKAVCNEKKCDCSPGNRALEIQFHNLKPWFKQINDFRAFGSAQFVVKTPKFSLIFLGGSGEHSPDLSFTSLATNCPPP